MINIDSALKTIYKNDRLPLTDQLSDKDMIAIFTGLGLTVAADQFAEDKGEFELTESICTDNQIKFGKCNSSQVKFTLADVTDAIKGQEFSLTQKVNDTYDMPYGIFTVDTCPKQDDLIFKDVTAYDRMKKIDTDVAAWYNGLTFPMTLADFRASFLAYVGLEEDTSMLPLPNDSMTVEKTLNNPAQLSGRTVIESEEELQGAFGHINRYGKFSHIVLMPSFGLYPSVTLYPSSALYPVSETDKTFTQGDLISESIVTYENVKFEEYTVKEIDKLIIRQDDNDIGAIVGTGSNAYVIKGNFLVYGKSASELTTIAANAFGNMAKRPYRPFESNNIGLPYIEVGDAIKFQTDDPVVSYVFSRTLKGIQALVDTYKADGSELQTEQASGTNYEIQQLKGKANKIVKTVEQLSVSVSDTEKALSGEIDVLAGQVVLKVDANGNIALVELDGDPSKGTSIKIKADNISLEGLVTANDNFQILLDGSMKAVKGDFNGKVTCTEGSIGGWDINSSGISTKNQDVSIDIYNQDNHALKLTYGGVHLFNHYIQSAEYLGGLISTYESSDGVNGVCLVQSQSAEYLGIGYLDKASPPSNDGNVTFGLLYTHGGMTLGEVSYAAGFHFNTDINMNYNQINNCGMINGGIPVTSQNIASQTVDHATSADNATNANYAKSAGSASLSNEWRYAIVTNVSALSSHVGYSLPVPWPVN